MQFLGNIVEYILGKSGGKLNILTATSGDTGSAAIHAFANKENIKIIVLHPKGKVTEFQRKQMTTNHAKNVLNIAIDGTFDDCQAIVKSITNSPLAKEKNISTVNSINWGRIMMQMVYYIKLLENETNANIFVPTGNFGNIFACYFLKKCGFEGIGKMFISNNENDIISTTHQTGIMQNKKSVATISPAIDISLPSNFERMLYIESGFDSGKIAEIYTQIKGGCVELPSEILGNFRNYFDASCITNTETLSAIKKCYDDFGYIIDPHTAVSFAHFEKSGVENGVIISTAHPCKFENAVFDAIGIKAEIPKSNQGVMEMQERLEFSSSEKAENVILGFFG
jgi:threonine synthase